MDVFCECCGRPLRLANAEPAELVPSPVFRLSPEQANTDAIALGTDVWALATGDDHQTLRHFVRATLPMPVLGEQGAIHWGVWVELDGNQIVDILNTWSDPEQAALPAIPALLASEISEFPGSESLAGELRRRGPTLRPEFHLAPDCEHVLARLQRLGCQRAAVHAILKGRAEPQSQPEAGSA